MQNTTAVQFEVCFDFIFSNCFMSVNVSCYGRFSVQTSDVIECIVVVSCAVLLVIFWLEIYIGEVQRV